MSEIVPIINHDRVELSEVVPLETPFTLNVYINNICNFRCKYCFQSMQPQDLARYVGKRMNMDFATFQKVADGALQFPQKIKCLLFTGLGEPLLNPDLPRMISYANSLQIAERIELITNASTLTHQLSDALIDAGLTHLRISVQGIDAQKYAEIADVNIDFDQFIEQIQYFYNRKQGHPCKVYAKIADVALDGKDPNCFYQLFDSITDSMAVEHIVELYDEVDYSVFHKKLEKTKSDEGIDHLEICPYSFYSMCVFMDGTISNCYLKQFSARGNVNQMTIAQAWNSPQTKEFWLKLLKNQKVGTACETCSLALGHVKKGDVIDHKADEIAKRIQSALERTVTI